MNKSELIEKVAQRLQDSRKEAEDAIKTSRKDAAEAVEAVLETIKSEVAKGERVAISGFGIFEK
ncbi:MAG TPA: HU family DNA-binding protein, partial [Actinomycetota bacterium]|nr:HU family DNA-binding protein [Actinomycetota bacterium]